MAAGLTGGCACGAVRYRLEAEPFDAGWCHCRLCQQSTGAPAFAFASVPTGRMVMEGATPKEVRLTDFGRRGMCPECGTMLTIAVDFQPDTLDFAVATLDDPAAVPPGFHIFWSSRVPWFPTGDGLPRFDRYRPDTRGLTGTEPPSP